jgi:hypothetical protein
MGAITRIGIARGEHGVTAGFDVDAAGPLVHDNVDPVVGLDLAHGPSGEPAGLRDDQVSQVDVLAGELKALVDLAARGGCDERRGGHLRGRDRRHGKRSGNLGGQGFVEQPEHDSSPGVQVAGQEPDVQVGKGRRRSS